MIEIADEAVTLTDIGLFIIFNCIDLPLQG